MNPKLPKFVVAHTVDTDTADDDRAFVIHLHEPYVVFEVLAESEEDLNLVAIDHRVSNDDANALLLASLAKQAGDYYLMHLADCEAEEDWDDETL